MIPPGVIEADAEHELWIVIIIIELLTGAVVIGSRVDGIVGRILILVVVP
jgi:hypothetical protein